ncbi:TrbC/VirB2 family protein [Ureibacillus galli]|uniref:TrbC/VirB2 family protein n=1 Tax=Ureibacillus galli TaxID=2762222 RepID=UPI001CD8B54F|nr:TrbC/VirB2 family protein [Ureibacillus galli]
MESVWELKEEFSPLVIRKTNEPETVSEIKKSRKKVNLKVPALTTLFLTPTTAFASGTFENVYWTVMGMFDHAVVLVIIFAGAAWMLGHRSKAIEHLIGAACGYLLALHAIDIRDFLKTL